MWNIGEPEPLYGNFRGLWNFNLYVELRGTWNLLKIKPLYIILQNLIPGVGRLPQITPKFYWKNLKIFYLLGK